MALLFIGLGIPLPSGCATCTRVGAKSSACCVVLMTETRLVRLGLLWAAAFSPWPMAEAGVIAASRRRGNRTWVGLA